MCGIAGLMMKQQAPADEAVLDRLVRAMKHRGSDSEGRHVQDNVGLVATRLAVVDIKGGNQPLMAPDGTALVCNGEIYNAPNIRRKLPDYPYQSRSDCEPVLSLFQRDGLHFAHSLRGMYALALHQPRTETLILARDPFGIKPLYYTNTECCVAFASELQALLRAGLALPEVTPRSRAELLQLKYTTGRSTIASSVQRVAPGETLVLRHGEIVERRRLPAIPNNIQIKRHSPLTGVPTKGKLRYVLQQFERVMSEALEVHLRMDTSWCLFLSGGIDSSVLLTLARQVLGRSVQAMTMGYSGTSRMDESREAVRIAERIGAECVRVEMSSNDFWTLAPRIAAAMDDPIADAAVLPTYLLGRAASEGGAKVALTGEGADEIFGGYSRYRKATVPLLFWKRRQRRGVFSKLGISTERFGAWSTGIEAAESCEKLGRHSRLQILQATDLKERLPNCLLIKLDRCLMAHGVEGRTPFLDREVLRFAMNLPDELKANLRFGKVLLRKWLAGANPAAQPYARKRGFDVPVGEWIYERRTKLASLVSRQPGIAVVFSEDEVARIFGGARVAAQPAWSTLFYALWHSHHILGVAPDGDVAAVLNTALEVSRGRMTRFVTPIADPADLPP